MKSSGTKSTKRRLFILLTMTIVGIIAVGNVLFFSSPNNVQTLDLSSLELHEIYLKWKVQHNIVYLGEEDKMREAIFANNYKKIMTHNATPGATYKMGINKFTALTEEELRKHYGLKPVKKISTSGSNNKTLELDFLE